MSIRYGQFSEAVAELGKLANSPGLTEPQKKVATDMLEQMKSVIGISAAKTQ
jgi:hypothetical protein